MLKLRNGWPQTPPFGTMICTLSSVTSSVQNSDSSLTVPRLPPTCTLWPTLENEAVLVDGTPEPMLLPGDADDDLIKVPFVATARRSPTDAVGEFPPEFEAPLPDRLVRHRDAAGGPHLLDHAQAQREPKIPPSRPAADPSGAPR